MAVRRITAVLLAAAVLCGAGTGCADKNSSAGVQELSSAAPAESGSAAESQVQSEPESSVSGSVPDSSPESSPESSAAEESSAQTTVPEEPIKLDGLTLEQFEAVLPALWGGKLEAAETALTDQLHIPLGKPALNFDAGTDETIKDVYDTHNMPYIKVWIYDMSKNPVKVLGADCRAVEIELTYSEIGGEEVVSGVFFDVYNEDGSGNGTELHVEELTRISGDWKKAITQRCGENLEFFNYYSAMWIDGRLGTIKLMLPEKDGDFKSATLKFSPVMTQ